MTVPPGPAGPFRFTVPVAESPAATVVGATVKPLSVAGFTVNVALTAIEPTEAEMTAEVVLDTPVVVTVKVAIVCPAGTVTVAGGVALDEFEESVTMAPPDAAGPPIVTVPVEVPPHITEVGESVSKIGTGGLTVNVAEALAEPMPAVMLAKVCLETGEVVMVNVPEEAPALIVMLEGTVAQALLLDKETAMPPVGAAPLRLTVPVAEMPPKTEVGVIETLDGTGGTTVRFAVVEAEPTAAVIGACVFTATGAV